MQQKMSPSKGIAKRYANPGERKTAKKTLHKRTRQENKLVSSFRKEEIDVAPKWIW